MDGCAGSVLCVPVCGGSDCNKRVPFGTAGIVDGSPYVSSA
jgi:hypothetical protein